MAVLIRMPKMSDTMEQGIISRWIKQVGDKIIAGDILAEVQTDKATMELEAFEDGTLLYIGVAEQSAAQVNDLLAIIGDPDESIDDWLAPTAVADKPVEPSLSSDRVFASPLAKKIAAAKGYNIKDIQGSGQGGRVIKRDIIDFLTNISGQIAPDQDRPNYEDRPITPMRQAIANLLTESKTQIPHFYLRLSINMTKLVPFRQQLNGYAPTKISINDLIIKATALALMQHPAANSAWLTDKIRSYKEAHIGVAVAVRDGLIVPVVRCAQSKSLTAISKEVKILYEKAEQQKLTLEDTSGPTFTISNLGMLGIESFTAIINPPAACILAVGAMRETPIVQDNQIIPAYMLEVTLSCDHRVVDGVVGASFLSTLKDLLEQPLRLLL